jgi:deferrochelatase/peroxidase EfeB
MMAYDREAGRLPPASSGLATSVQAHLGRASRFVDGKTRNWSLFFFFRILSKARLAANLKQVALALDAKVAAGAAPTKLGDPQAPAQLFLDWLKVLVDAKSDDFWKTLRTECEKAGIQVPAQVGPDQEAYEFLFQTIEDFSKGAFARLPASFTTPIKADVARAAYVTLSNPDNFNAFVAKFGNTAAAAGRKAFSGGLLGAFAYELIRQFAPAQAGTKDSTGRLGVLRSEAAETGLKRDRDQADKQWDPVPINFSFTFPGLKALQLSEPTLASFPEAFKQGMAARAERLGDIGPSAPENWEGVLGLDCVHGYFTGGYLVDEHDEPVSEDFRRRLRDDVSAFNDSTGTNGWGDTLRAILTLLCLPLGIEVLHIELGEDPYEIDKNGRAVRPPYRMEHFGFRDGISQPFVDMNLGDPLPGGGTPSRNRTWAPVAHGEIYLSERDEDGNKHHLPIHESLRDGSTFLVFRKLEQDVVAFRAYLARQRPNDRAAQDKLAAQFLGRWPNGTPLAAAPDAPRDLGRDPDGLLNDFRYAADDPKGLRCPLGSHIRRSNPRDIGGTNDVRRHRILRRGIAYGGSLLPMDSPGDGRKRGLLFIAANSRLDLQFEVIQGDWINKGEILGQAGLGRCPLTGANLGGPGDSFLESGAVAPVTGLPPFVITRGGDYFFAPGVTAMRELAYGSKFDVLPEKLPYAGYSMGDAKTPALLSDERMKAVVGQIFAGARDVVRVGMPSSALGDPGAAPVAFVARLAHVKQALSKRTNASDQMITSVVHYQEAIRAISPGQDMIVSTQPDSVTGKTRKLMLEILEAGWAALSTEEEPVYLRLAQITKRSIEATLRRTASRRAIDIVYDLGAVTTYNVVSDLFGTPGPDWLTEMAVALRFSRQHLTQVDPDWLAAMKAGRPEDVGLATWQVWSILMFVDIVGNYLQQDEVKALGVQAGREFLTHIDTLIVKAKKQPRKAHTNLLAAFVSLEKKFTDPARPIPLSVDAYYGLVRMLLLEVASSAVVIAPTLGTVVHTALTGGIDLTSLIQLLMKVTPSQAKFDEGIKRLLYETWRLNPTVRLLMRRSNQAEQYGKDMIQEGDWIAALIAAGCADPTAFEYPKQFSLDPILPGPKRNIEDYLLFGDATEPGRLCWGRDKLALYLLTECLKATGRLKGLKKVAGAGGELKKVAQVNIGLQTRFVSVLPDWPKKQP